MFYTYVIESQKNGNWYTGYTHDLRKRILEHNSGVSKYTRHRGPFRLVYYEACYNKKDAKAREIYLKSGMGKRYLKNRIQNFLNEVMNPVRSRGRNN